MQLILDLSLIFIIFMFSYAFGRRSQVDGQPVIPPIVTLFSLFIIIGVYIVINLPGIIQVMVAYSSR